MTLCWWPSTTATESVDEQIDFVWVLFVGTTLLGFSKKEVGHMTYYQWNQLFEYYKQFHNFKIQNKLFEIKPTEEEYSYEWFKD